MMLETSHSSSARSGFTLIETLVVITLIGLVVGVISLAVSVIVRNEGSVSTRITETRDLQNLTNFLPRDVASARVITKAPATADECGSGGTVELHLEWDEEWLGTLFEQRVTYREVGTSELSLVRFSCVNGDPAESVVVAAVYTDVELECPASGTTVTGTVTFASETRTITATSRNYPYTETC